MRGTRYLPSAATVLEGVAETLFPDFPPGGLFRLIELFNGNRDFPARRWANPADKDRVLNTQWDGIQGHADYLKTAAEQWASVWQHGQVQELE